MDLRRKGPGRLGRAMLAEAFSRSRLLQGPLGAQAAALGAGFPRAIGRNMFLEYEFGPGPIPAGMGFGFAAGALDHCVAVRAPFLDTRKGRAIATALAEDPFTEDHATHLNLGGDPDPDWVEYDIVGGGLDPSPFIFFRAPDRFRTITTRPQARDFCNVLSGRSRGEALAGLLETLLVGGPADLYRIGAARRRGPGWRRVIISRLNEQQVAAAFGGLAPAGLADALAASRRFYDAHMDAPGACYALSVDLREGEITAMDVECPYLFRIGHAASRSEPFAALLRSLADCAMIGAGAAEWLSTQCRRDIALPSGERLRVTMHHLKHRFLGAPLRRTKAYLHLELIGPDRAEAQA